MKLKNGNPQQKNQLTKLSRNENKPFHSSSIDYRIICEGCEKRGEAKRHECVGLLLLEGKYNIVRHNKTKLVLKCVRLVSIQVTDK